MRDRSRWRSRLAGATAAALLVLGTAACAARPPVASDAAPTAVATYSGSLVSEPAPVRTKGDASRPGAAGRALDCVTEPVGETRLWLPFDGEDTGATAAAALEVSRRWYDWSGVQDGYVLERTEGPRRLYVFRMDGAAKQALILRHGPALKGDGTRATVDRWWLEAWARCDWSELPDAVVAAEHLQLWRDGRGRTVPTTTVVSLDLPCVAGATVLRRGTTEYVRTTGSAPDPLPGGYREHEQVPSDAVDSGLQRDGRHLWWAADGSAAFVGGREDAERWPRASQRIGCTD